MVRLPVATDVTTVFEAVSITRTADALYAVT
jgi:hypothetical protein